MGTYLSVPVREKQEETGECFVDNIPLAWGVVDMQGWRKSMEDAHVTQTGVEIHGSKEDAKIFGVFDGHGGPEVAHFCSMYLVSVLKQQATWRKQAKRETTGEEDDDYLELLTPKETDLGLALVNTFHALDRMIDSASRR
jgi:serine/threonine protein phosphatase PrpC